MKLEWKKQSRDGKRIFHAGIGTADAVGTAHPASEVPIGEGMRLLFAKGVDRIWICILAAVFLRRLTRPRRRHK